MALCSEYQSRWSKLLEIILCRKPVSEFRYNDEFCDVSIRVQERTFKCHRVVLAYLSDYFKSTFARNVNNSDEIILHDTDAVIFEIILNFVYEGRELAVNEGNAHGLLCASDFLGMPAVRDSCVEFILKNMRSIEAIEIFILARALNHASLTDSLSRFIVRHLVKFTQKSAFLKIPFDDLIILLNQYESTVPFKNENFLLDAIIRWVYYSYHERIQYLERLVQKIDFEKLSSEYQQFILKEYILNGDAIDVSEVERSTLKSTLISNFKLRSEGTNDSREVLLIPYRDPQFENIVSTLHIYLQLEDNESNYVYQVFSMNAYKVTPDWFASCTFYKPKEVSNEFQELMISCIASEEPNHVYCFEYGLFGEGEKTVFNRYSSTDLSSNPQELTPFPLSTVRACFPKRPGMCKVGSNIYLYRTDTNLYDVDSARPLLPEGFSEEEYTRGIYRYNCEIDRWFPVPKMKENIACSYLVTNNNLVFLIGGNSCDTYVQTYDDRTSNWLELPRTTYEHSCLGAGCVVNGKVHVVNYSGEMEAFDSTAGRWDIINCAGINETEYHYQLRMVYYDNLLWLFGRALFTGLYNFNTYDPVSQEWGTSTTFNETYDAPFSVREVFAFTPIE